jgi:hypothetical protein
VRNQHPAPMIPCLPLRRVGTTLLQKIVTCSRESKLLCNDCRPAICLHAK